MVSVFETNPSGGDIMENSCFKCGRDLANGLCMGCQNAPKECTCEEETETE